MLKFESYVKSVVQMKKLLAKEMTIKFKGTQLILGESTTQHGLIQNNKSIAYSIIASNL